MFTYVFENVQDFKIHTPGVADFSQIKKTIEQTADHIVNKSEYPTGLQLEIDQYADRIIVYSNRELIQNEDGSLTAPEE